MRLSELVNAGGTSAENNVSDTEISGLTADSRDVRPGFLFAALPGAARDGRDYIDQALANGAVAILAPPSVQPAAIGAGARLVTDPAPRRRLALMAARFHHAQPDTVAAVTGTNGKTSVASFIQQLWTLLGHRGAAMGTLGITAAGWDSGPGLTTPDPVRLHEMLAALKRDGINHLALEASSHGLDQSRLDGVRIAAAAFTNLSRDHLDYHATMDAYLESKLRLFDELLCDGGVAVVDAASPQHGRIAEIARRRGLRLITYGRDGGDISCREAPLDAGGWSLSIDIMGAHFDTELALPGAFQVTNALCALAVVVGCGADPRMTAPLLSRLVGVPGRMQVAGRRASGAPVIVDYAHTPDALETVLRAARAHADGRLIVVFGCGGDRDAGKRARMGEIAARLSDLAFVTDDNPRGEDAASIRRQILDACPDAVEIGDRGAAIRAGIEALGAGDVLVVAGKGHEQGQIVGDQTLPFDDIAVARSAIQDIEDAPS